METRAQITTDGTFEISGTINSRLPSITDGLVSYYPFDGTISPVIADDFSALKVLTYSSHTSHATIDWFNSNTATTATTTLITDDISTIVSTYDLVVIDEFVWSVAVSLMSRAKELVDAGISVIATGNDTRTNVFVTGYDSTGHETYSYETIYGETISGGGSDLYGGITTLAYGAKALYRRADGNNQIIGYTYTSPISGALLFFDQNGNGPASNIAFQDGIKEAIEHTKGRRSLNPLCINNDGLSIETEVINLYKQWSLIPGGTYPYRVSAYYDSTIESGLLDQYGTKNAVRYIASDITSVLRYGESDGSNPDFTYGNTYTFSVYAKLGSHSKAPSNFTLDIADQTSDNFATLLTDEWQRFEITQTISNTSYGFVDITISAEDEILLSYPQIELGTYSSVFTDSSRIASPGFYIPNPVTTGNFTINFKCKINTNIGTPLTYQTIFSMGSYYTNNSFTIMDTGNPTVSGTQKLIRKGDGGEWNWANAAFTNSTNFQNNNVYTIVRDATNYRCFINGIYVAYVSHASVTMGDLIWVGSKHNGGEAGSSTITDLAIYNRALSDSEVLELGSSVFNLQTDGCLHNTVKTDDIPGWTKIFEGLASQTVNEDYHDGEILDYYGEDVLFDEVMVRAVYWDYTYSLTTTKTAKLKYSIKWYTAWLFDQADSTSPQMKFHGIDDIQDVGFTTTGLMYEGHGYSSRGIAPLFPYIYRDNVQMFVGNITDEIVTEDWEAIHGDTTHYAKYMNLNYPKESGVYNLTPREAQTIQIYVRLRPNGTTNSRMEVLDGTINPSTIHTKEVL